MIEPPEHGEHDRGFDAYADLAPSNEAPAWLHQLHHEAPSPGLRPVDGGRRSGGVLAITEPNALSARAGVLKYATSVKRKRNLLHEARVLALLARSSAQAGALAPGLLGLWRLDPPDTLYMLTNTLSGTPLAELPAERPPELSSHICCLIDALQSFELPTGLTNEGVEIESWPKHASAELARYADLLDGHGHTDAADALRHLRESPIDQSGGHRLVHRDLSPSNLIIDRRLDHAAVRACDFASSFFGPRLWELAGAELFLFPAYPELRAPLRSHFERVAGDTCAEQTLCLAAWQIGRLYAAAHHHADTAATRRFAHALSTITVDREPEMTDCYRRAAKLGDLLHFR